LKIKIKFKLKLNSDVFYQSALIKFREIIDVYFENNTDHVHCVGKYFFVLKEMVHRVTNTLSRVKYNVTFPLCISN
jgi:hypothetical protein